MGVFGKLIGKNAPYIPSNDGGEQEFKARYVEGQVLGQGEFGSVKLCRASSSSTTSEDLAVKILKKGMTFKDNTLYGALKPEVLQAECEILKILGGKQYCLELKGIYETPKVIYVITELCSGGEMMQYVSQRSELRTEDVSRIAYQLLSAVNHCASNGVIHRDIKAENVMFCSSDSQAELRLIDFGCGVLDKQTRSADALQHSTFAGSAFYISPEMFQKTYTNKTDVWSVGVVLYVLVAGYPADELQKAFNILQKSKGRDIRALPNLPNNMPDTYYEMLECLLTYPHKARPSAGDMLKHEFVQFHNSHTVPSTKRRAKASRTASVRFQGSVERHGMAVGYQSFERAVTTILATMLANEKLCQLVAVLESNDKNHSQNKLKVVSISKLKTVLEDMNHSECVDIIGNLPNASIYDTFAYHVALVKQFARGATVNGQPTQGGKRMSISGDIMSMQQTNRRASVTTTISKLDGTTKDALQKPMQSQSVAGPRSKQVRATSVVVGGFGASGEQTSVSLDELKAFQLAATTNESGMTVKTKKGMTNGFAGLEHLVEEEEEDEPAIPTRKATTTAWDTLDEGEYDC